MKKNAKITDWSCGCQPPVTVTHQYISLFCLFDNGFSYNSIIHKLGTTFKELRAIQKLNAVRFEAQLGYFEIYLINPKRSTAQSKYVCCIRVLNLVEHMPELGGNPQIFLFKQKKKRISKNKIRITHQCFGSPFPFNPLCYILLKSHSYPRVEE